MDLTVFDHFPEPVYFLRTGKLQYRNRAALALEPAWSEGEAAPAELSPEPDDEGAFSCTVDGKLFQAAVTRTDGGLLLVLRPTAGREKPLPAALAAQIRERLNSMQGAAQMLEVSIEEDAGEGAQPYLAMLRQGFYRLLRLAKHLELSKEETFTPEEGSVDLAELCRTTVYSASALAERAGVALRGETPGGAMVCAGDKALLEILLLELISNAIKAAGKGGEAGLRLSTDGHWAHITVWDNGPGMSQQEMAAVMQGAVPDGPPRPGAGLGLGLPIARRAAAAHGGTVLLENREGVGMRATAALPLQKPGKAPIRVPHPGPEEDFSLLLTILSDALPWQIFGPDI